MCQGGSLDVVSWDLQAHPLYFSPQIEAICQCRLGKPNQNGYAEITTVQLGGMEEDISWSFSEQL